MNPKITIFLSVVLIIIIAGGAFFLRSPKITDHSPEVYALDAAVDRIIRDFDQTAPEDISEEQISGTSGRVKAVRITKEVTLSPDISLSAIKDALAKDTGSPAVTITKIQTRKNRDEQIMTMDFSREQLHIYRLILKQKQITHKIALVIDDWGYSKDIIKKGLEADIAMTFAVLPGLPYSRQTAEDAHARGHEIILHLPLEPHNAQNIKLEKNTLLTSMSEPQIIQISDQQIAAVPHLKGFNNHMGSKATEDPRLMSILFQQAQKKNLYFLDSYTSPRSCAKTVARELGIKTFQRDIFLDDENTREAILKQLEITKNIARKKGAVIAIGHARALTMEVLAEEARNIENAGFRFVYLSDLGPARD